MPFAPGSRRLTASAKAAGESAGGFYQQQVAKFKDVLSGPPVKETCEVTVRLQPACGTVASR